MRLTRQQRTAAIMEAAVIFANKHGLAQCDFTSVARTVSVPTSPYAIRYHYKTKAEFWRAIVSHKNASTAVKEHARILGVQ